MALASWDGEGEGRRAGELGWKEPSRELKKGEEVAALGDSMQPRAVRANFLSGTMNREIWVLNQRVRRPRGKGEV